MSPPQRTRQRLPLPNAFTSIRDILDGKRPVGTMVNIIGIVTEFRTPVSTRGSDWKCQVRLNDHSIQDFNEDALIFNVFRPENEMPDFGLGDIVVIFQAKLQNHLESISLISSRTTDIHIYLADGIPAPPQEASGALKPLSRRVSRNPGKTEHDYVSHLHHFFDREKLPTESEFEAVKLKSASVADKFAQLKDVRDGVFADVVAQIVKVPYHMGDKLTLWISDYTENEMFFHFTFKGINTLEAQDANPYGYPTNLPNIGESGTEWTGPFGKRSMQVTCFEPHASAIRDKNLSAGSWVMLRNMHIKYGHNAANLEGFLREDRDARGVKINVVPLDPSDMDTPDPRLKEAIRRKRDYERAKKDQLKGIVEAAKAGQKRKGDVTDTGKLSNSKAKSKARRKAKRAAERAEQSEVQEVDMANINSQVKCEHQNKAASLVEDIIKPVYLQTVVEGEELKLQLPFTNANYRANVRVVSFMPPTLEDFSLPKKSSEYAMLSDNDESDSGSESEQGMTDPSNHREWEWRFFLELEDAMPEVSDKGQKKTVWVAVDNHAAQCLMHLDASDLRRDQDNLEALRQKLFLLWGELEEHKSREVTEKARAARVAKQDRPPLDSSDDEGRAQKQGQKTTEVNNRPFSCCIRQYGVQVPESNPSKADAGDGKRWQRTFGLFGTKIV